MFKFALNDTVTAARIELAIGFAATITACIVGFAVVAFLAIECIEGTVAAARRNVSTVKAASTVSTCIDTVVADLADSRRNNAIAADWTLAFVRTHIVIGEIAVVAFFSVGHDTVAAA